MGFAPSELRKFTEAGVALSKAASISFEQWADGEAEQILGGWVSLIDASTMDAAERRARTNVLNKLGLTRGAETINSGARGPEGRVWIRSRKGRWQLAGVVSHNAGPFVPSKRRMQDGDWNAAKDSVNEFQGKVGVIAMAKRTIGLARQSVVQIADVLGYAIERAARGLSASDISQARGAVASDGNTYQNGTGVRTRSGSYFSVELINRYPLIQQAKVDRALAETIASRTTLMQQAAAVKLGRGMRDAAGAFPYLQVGR